MLTYDHRNFKYPNRALMPNQSFPIASLAGETSASTEDSSTTLTHFDLSTAVASPLSIASAGVLSVKAQKKILLYTKTQKLSINSNHPQGFINRTSWAPQASPAVPLISLPRSEWDSNQFIPWISTTEKGGTWVDIIINNLDDGAHPFHLHGHDFFVLASYRSEHGWGSYSPYVHGGASSLKPVLNLENPVRKDTVSVPRRGYVVIRFWADNPGIWMLHCHVLFHQASGMAMGLQVGGEEEHGDVDVTASKLCEKKD